MRTNQGALRHCLVLALVFAAPAVARAAEDEKRPTPPPQSPAPARAAEKPSQTAAQAAQLAGLTTRHITRLLQRSTIPGVKPGRDWLVKPSAVMRYLEQERRPGRKPRRTERPPLDK